MSQARVETVSHRASRPRIVGSAVRTLTLGLATGLVAGARAAYEGPWNFWNGVRTVFSSTAFLALVGACLLREDRSGR